jgi:hypothetical protein
MKTHNLVIYHCLACGAVMHCEPDQDVPECCGRSMIKAAAETVGNDEAPSAGESGAPSDARSRADAAPQKPR